MWRTHSYTNCWAHQAHIDGGESVCAVFIKFSTLTINNLFNIMHYHIIIISSPALLLSSHRKHSTQDFTWKPKSWGENHESLFNNSCPEITGCKEQLSYYIDFNFLASTERRIRLPVLQAATWRKLPLPSFLASTGRRLRPPSLAPSCHPNKKI